MALSLAPTVPANWFIGPNEKDATIKQTPYEEETKKWRDYLCTDPNTSFESIQHESILDLAGHLYSCLLWFASCCTRFVYKFIYKFALVGQCET